ncbi:sensor domain-containing protein [Mycolicibacterium sp. 050232]|uniref:sensor domain-containing protein n=1 Tax=Mycolicibacterium sp. 050232 TaxID=3113982 RepID=UPI002E2ABC4E|nr:sensor domain-containing protein [Mycolicibacterium sp. 050232]MED5810824.1 sensor domain-containing protein [Mycolicibacterium sp. 050232]
MPSTSATAAAVLSVEEVRTISGVNGFHEVPELDAAAPAANADTPEPCRAVFDPSTVFGSEWKQFRAVGYAADLEAPLLPIMADVRQAIAVYPDAATAQATFDRVAAAIPGCIKTGTGYYRRTAESPDPNTLLLNSDHADGAHSAYRLAGTALISVGVLGLPDSARVVLAILDGIGQAEHQ